MSKQVPLGDAVGIQPAQIGEVVEILPDLAYQRLAIVNVVYVGRPKTGPWVLIDAGVAGSANAIEQAAESRFGAGHRPVAIVMTHGHFDHVGALEELAARWEVPVHSHPLEQPYLNGESSYPPANPQAGGGMMSQLSRFYPRGPVDVGSRWRPLPSDGQVPGMPGWQWIPTPGHTPGQIALWRPADRTLIAGDAIITTAQESAYAVLTQRPELHGPPMYFTPDWDAAEQSVRRLASLEPDRTVTGHGPALSGAELRRALHELAERFREVAVPASH